MAKTPEQEESDRKASKRVRDMLLRERQRAIAKGVICGCDECKGRRPHL